MTLLWDQQHFGLDVSWLADRLVEAWSEAEQNGTFFNADGTVIVKEEEGEVGLLPQSTSENFVAG